MSVIGNIDAFAVAAPVAPHRVVSRRDALRRAGPLGQVGRSREPSGRTIADGADRFQRHAAGALGGPGVGLLEKDGAGEAE